jgi:adenylate cyclase
VASVRFSPDGQDVPVEKGATLLEAALDAGIQHAHACGGRARCSTCRVLVVRGLERCTARNAAEQHIADQLHFPPDVRLACQTRMDGDGEVRRLVLDAEDIELTELRANRTPVVPGEEKRVAILFADIRGFTAFSESMPAYDVVHMLNRVFSQMDVAIHAHRGSIDNVMGDGLMALFGLQGSDPTGASLDAIRAGLDMLAAHDRLKPYLARAYGRSLEIGIGIHTGSAVIGAIGGRSSRRITAIGNAVNVASRIESANKEAGTRLLISDDTFALVEAEVRIGTTSTVVLRGKRGEHRIHEVIGIRPPVSSNRLP